jgi:hypothetical protein
MPSSTSRREYREAHERRRVLALWTGLLAGPIVWLALLESNYVLSYVACELRQTWFLHLAAAVSLALVGAAGLWGWSAGHGQLEFQEPLTPPISAATCDTRARWMAVAGAAVSAFFIMVILSLEVPLLVLRPCQ